MTTAPGFSSRSQSTSVRQFPMRDEAVMIEPGFSNSKAVKDAPEDIHPDVTADPLIKPGASNTAEDKATTEADARRASELGVVAVAGDPVDAKQLDTATVEDKAVRKTTARKSKA